MLIYKLENRLRGLQRVEVEATAPGREAGETAAAAAAEDRQDTGVPEAWVACTEHLLTRCAHFVQKKGRSYSRLRSERMTSVTGNGRFVTAAASATARRSRDRICGSP